MILFLDFDGVVTPLLDYHTGLHMARLPLLEDVLRMRPEVKIVISSTWRNTRSFTQLQKFFSPDISSRIIGMTPHWRDVQDETTFGLYVRQAEIESWLRFSENPWQTWLALDDQAHLFRPFCPNLMLINPNKGLTEDDCEALLSRLLL